MTTIDFVDTNVLVYAVDVRDPVKQQASHDILDERGGQLAISVQVLGEYFVTVTRKLPKPLTLDEAEQGVAALCALPVVPLDVGLVRAAMTTAREHQLAYWDALIVEAAVTAGCERVFSEDLNAWQVIRGVEIVNPFAN